MGGTTNDNSHFFVQIKGFQYSDQDVNSSDSDITYTLYLDRYGGWYIMREDVSVSDDDNVKAIRFIKGSIDSDTNWTAREALDYDTFYETFK